MIRVKEVIVTNFDDDRLIVFGSDSYGPYFVLVVPKWSIEIGKEERVIKNGKRKIKFESYAGNKGIEDWVEAVREWMRGADTWFKTSTGDYELDAIYITGRTAYTTDDATYSVDTFLVKELLKFFDEKNVEFARVNATYDNYKFSAVIIRHNSLSYSVIAMMRFNEEDF